MTFDQSGGVLPPKSPPVCVAFFLMLEMGQTAESLYGVPFMRLPPQIGADLVYLMQRHVSSKQGRLDEIAQGLRFK